MTDLVEIGEMFLTVETDVAAIGRKVQELPRNFEVNAAESLLSTALNALEEARGWLIHD